MKTPRMSATLAVALLLALAIAVVAPQQLPVTLYKLSLIAIAAVGGYYIDRELFPYARPDWLLGRWQHGSDKIGAYLAGAAMARRALVVSACIVAVALGA